MAYAPFLQKKEMVGTGANPEIMDFHPPERLGVYALDRISASVNVAATTMLEIGIQNGIDRIPLTCKYVQYAGESVDVQGPVILEKGYKIYVKTSAAITNYTLTLTVCGHYSLPD